MPNENLTKECNCFTLSLPLVLWCALRYGYCWYNLYAPSPFTEVFALSFCAECVLTRDIVPYVNYIYCCLDQDSMEERNLYLNGIFPA